MRAREARPAAPRPAGYCPRASLRHAARGCRQQAAGGPAAAMGLCCCKDWREHLRAPKGNSRCARAPRARDLCASVRSARRRLPPAAAGGYYLLIPDLSASFPGPPDTCRSLGKDSGRVSELWSAHSRVALAPRCQLEPGAGPWAGEERCGAHSGHPLQVRQVHAGEEESRVPCPAPPTRRSSAEGAGPAPGAASAA